MDNDKTEALDLSLPRKSKCSSPQARRRHINRKDDCVPSTAKRQKYSPPSSFALNGLNTQLCSDVCIVPTQSPEHHFTEEIVSFSDENVTPHSSMKQSSGNVSVSLHDEKLWREFRTLGTEMIINRSGRRMFPHVVVTVQGMDPESYYSITLEIVPADNRRYKYVHNQWMPIGAEDPGRDVQPVAHPDSPSLGSHWLRNKISFSKVRLTNSKESSAKENADGNILLLSMHKYLVVIKIKKEGHNFSDAEMEFVFHESTFFAVTAYQNSKITQLKIQNNPFAKAFRDAPSPSSVEQHKSSIKGRGVKDVCQDVKSKSIKSTEPCSSITDSSGVPHSAISFPHGMFGGLHMTALDQIYNAALESRNLQASSYFPWFAMRSSFPHPFWHKDSIYNGQYLPNDTNTTQHPIEMGQPPSNFHSHSLKRENICPDNKSPASDEQQSQSVK